MIAGGGLPLEFYCALRHPGRLLPSGNSSGTSYLQRTAAGVGESRVFEQK